METDFFYRLLPNGITHRAEVNECGIRNGECGRKTCSQVEHRTLDAGYSMLDSAILHVQIFLSFIQYRESSNEYPVIETSNKAPVNL